MSIFDYRAYVDELEEELEALQEEVYRLTCAIEVAKKRIPKKMPSYQPRTIQPHTSFQEFKKRNENGNERRPSFSVEEGYPENRSDIERSAISFEGLPLRAAVRQYLKNQLVPKTKEDILQALYVGGFQSKSERFPQNLDPTLRFMVYDGEIDKVGSGWQIKESA